MRVEHPKHSFQQKKHSSHVFPAAIKKINAASFFSWGTLKIIVVLLFDLNGDRHHSSLLCYSKAAFSFLHGQNGMFSVTIRRRDAQLIQTWARKSDDDVEGFLHLRMPADEKWAVPSAQCQSWKTSKNNAGNIFFFFGRPRIDLDDLPLPEPRPWLSALTFLHIPVSLTFTL